MHQSYLLEFVTQRTWTTILETFVPVPLTCCERELNPGRLYVPFSLITSHISSRRFLYFTKLALTSENVEVSIFVDWVGCFRMIKYRCSNNDGIIQTFSLTILKVALPWDIFRKYMLHTPH